MADIVDDAERQQQNLLDAAIKESRIKANFDINGDGICLSCGMIVETGRDSCGCHFKFRMAEQRDGGNLPRCHILEG